MLIAPQHRKCLCVFVAGRQYQYNILPFGLSSALRTFTKIVSVIGTYLRIQGIDIYQYLKDWLIKCSHLKILEEYLWTVLKFTKELEFLVNTEKYFLVPSQKLDCLGADRVLSEWIVSLLESKCISALEEVKWSFSTLIHRLLCSFFVCWDLRFLHPRCFYGSFRVVFASIWRLICKHSNWT